MIKAEVAECCSCHEPVFYGGPHVCHNGQGGGVFPHWDAAVAVDGTVVAVRALLPTEETA